MQPQTSLLLSAFALYPLAYAAPAPQSAASLGTSTTQNGLTNGSGCKAMTVIFARGTTEGGNVGSLSGPPFFAALSKIVGPDNMAVQGVEYPADIPGFLAGGDANGSKAMAQLVTKAMTMCPNTKVVMSGYRYVS
jgi:cutinase